MSFFTINHQKCTRDGLCAADCPIGIITMTESGPEPVDGAEQMCISCGHCVAVCPHGALELQTMPLEHCPSLREDWQFQPEQVEQFLKGRRSVRSYKEKPVERDVLAKIIDTARFAPTARNAQSIHWTVIYDPQDVRRIAGATIDWLREAVQTPHFSWAQSIITAWENGNDPICRAAPHLIFTHVPKEQAQMAASDGAIALTFLELAALPHQIGTCWAGFVMVAATMSPMVQAALKLPENHQFLGSMMIGYPDVKFYRIPMRKEPQVTWR